MIRTALLTLSVTAIVAGTATAQGRPRTSDYFALWKEAHAARDRGDCKLAIRLYTKAMAYAKTWPSGSRRFLLGLSSGHFYRGMCYRALGDYRRALADLDAVAGSSHLQDDEWLPYHERGLVHLSLGSPRKALADFSTAIRQQTAYPEWVAKIRMHARVGEPHLGRCESHKQLKQPAAAQRECRRAIAAYRTRCQTMEADGRPASEITACYASLASHPTVVKARVVLSSLGVK